MAALTLARAYQHSFDTRPNVTLAITGGSLNALGDCVAQIAESTVRICLVLVLFPEFELVFGYSSVPRHKSAGSMISCGRYGSLPMVQRLVRISMSLSSGILV